MPRRSSCLQKLGALAAYNSCSTVETKNHPPLWIVNVVHSRVRRSGLLYMHPPFLHTKVPTEMYYYKRAGHLLRPTTLRTVLLPSQFRPDRVCSIRHRCPRRHRLQSSHRSHRYPSSLPHLVRPPQPTGCSRGMQICDREKSTSKIVQRQLHF